MKKRMLAFAAAFLMLTTMIPAEVSAASGNENLTGSGNVSAVGMDDSDTFITDGEAYVNPIYADVIPEEEIDVPEEIEESAKSDSKKARSVTEISGAAEYCETIEEAAAVLREGLTAREESIKVFYHGEAYTKEYFSELCTGYIIPEALAETENANEGDYLRYNYGGTGYRAEISKDDEEKYTYYTIHFTPKYFTTAAQETTVTQRVNELLETEFSFAEGISDYEKLYEVYDYICSNVTYDNENLEDDTYTLKYTTYAALIDGTAVCQGYASLYYRLLRELGYGVRIVTGYGGIESEDETNYFGNHAWNIVQINQKWYYADSTWDAGFSAEVMEGTYRYQYFLKGTSDFDSLEEPYSTEGIHYPLMDEDFVNMYEVEETRYMADQESECEHDYIGVVTEPTCMEGGYTTYTCSLCGDSYIDDEMEASGHSWDAGVITKEATTTEEGVMTYTCTVCGETRTEVIPVKVITAPSVSLSLSQNNGKIRLTGMVNDYENIDDYYEITGHGFVYITKAQLNTRTLTVNISGRTKITINGIGSTGSYSYSMTPKKSDTVYAVRAWVSYKNTAGKTVYVYSNTICTSYDAIKAEF